METDSWMCGYAKKGEEYPNKYINMEITVQERLIGKVVFLRKRKLQLHGLILIRNGKKNVSIL
jgi:hypothetical protein